MNSPMHSNIIDVGAVSVLADILAEEEISIYYLSTYTTDFVLVRARH